MSNPKGTLAGWSDRPLDPNWRQNVIARVRAQQAENSAVAKTARRQGQVQLFFDLPFLAYLDAAAAARGMSRGSYGRRALAKQIAADLQVDWRELLQHCARPSPYGSRPPGRAPKGEKTTDDGQGYGDWS